MTDAPTPKTFLGRAPANPDDVLKALPYLPWDRALDACKLLVEQWLRDMSYFRSGPTKQKWEMVEPPVDLATRMPTTHRFWRLTLATATHHYYIRVGPTYLGCTATGRIALAGEKHLRGNDLPDGPFNRITWSRILTEMLAYEFVEIPKSEEAVTVPNLWDFVDEAAGKDKSDWAVEREKQLARPILGGAGAVAREVGFDEIVDDVAVAWAPGQCGIDWCRLNRMHLSAPDTCSPCVNGCHAPQEGCTECPAEKPYRDEQVVVGGHLPQ